MSRASQFAVLVTLLGSTPLGAQVCAGFPSFQGRPIQVQGMALFNNKSKAFGGSVGFGGAEEFGSLDLGTVRFDAYDASAFTVGGGVGYQLPLDTKGTVQMCPAVEVGFDVGPKNIRGTGFDYSETDISLGIGVGMVATRTEQVDVVPTGSIAFANAAGRLKDASGNTTSNSQSFGIIGLGVGFVFSHQVSIKPEVSFPVGVSGGSTTFGVTLAANLGRAP
jgi:hypothetical protein